MRCEICIIDEKEAKYRCRICGRSVCEDHYLKNMGICKICDMTLCYICRNRFAVAVCAICGRPVCEKDSVRRGLARICNQCLQQQLKELSEDQQ
ncbi:MAG: hypothetical protein GXO10_05645 [Crenarchaeota archaeon]|nr:hypothetical protein [Thermoproteota archaeon]